MYFNKALVNYLFKKGYKNDSSSVKIKPLIKELDEKLKNEDLVYSARTEESFSLQEYKLEKELERSEYLLSLIEKDVEKLDESIREKLVSLRIRLQESRDTVKQALLSERKLVGESYTLQIPISKEYSTNSTTATVEEGVVFGIGFDDLKTTTKVDVSSLHLLAEEFSSFKLKSQSSSYPLKIEWAENFTKHYNQLGINLSSVARSGILFIKFDKAETVSVLNKDGYEVIEPHVTTKLAINLDKDSSKFSIRFLNNTKRILQISEMYFTEAVYNTETVYETVPFQVGEDLSFITVQTCDNYSTGDVNLQYEISINGSSYRAFRPNGKLVAQNIQSIIRTRDVNPTETRIDYTELSNGFYRYYNEELVNINSRLKVFTHKMGVDFNSVENFVEGSVYELNMYCPNTFNLKLSPSMFVFLDGMRYGYEETPAIEVKQGLHTLKVEQRFWKELVDLDKYAIKSVDTNKIKVVSKITNELIDVDHVFDTATLATNSIYLQLFLSNVVVYLKEEFISRKYDRDYIEYFYKDTPEPIYIYSEAYQNTVNTVQLKITLKAINEQVCPYVSKLLLRGV